MKAKLTIALALAAVLPFSASAHRAWLLPSQTTAADADSWITVDAAVSNDLFYFNHVPLRLDRLGITAPDGSRVESNNHATGQYRSVFDLELKQTGTYRISIVNAGLFASWSEAGKRKRWRGSPEAFAAEVPHDAEDLEVREAIGRVETFVTRGGPTLGALKPVGTGLELIPITHPNDLYAGESATFGLQIDGKPAVGLEVQVVRGGTRYRDAQDVTKTQTDEDGEFSLNWSKPGMYWLEVATQDNKTSAPQAKSRRLSYVATFEVLPQ